ncbi:hypothetical protein GCM10007108_15180 [Thermogymnomonas acidicola]|uniref:Uncharacterized protein n=1 Tax=Thermogymnomonas acidicola TaxID=399579 RepID=A0AA37BSL1_9ARCH|nr:hypothetical protein [Thermogymnomonas acidicola]GGM77926.1 hypothetical protein GCM10007108_15180 [Thermogymnomonas acidicola]
MYRVLKLSGENRKLKDAIVSDDIVGRQTLVLKAGESVGEEPGSVIIIVEGGSEALAAVDRFVSSGAEELRDEAAQRVYSKVKEEEDSAEGGMGFIFG